MDRQQIAATVGATMIGAAAGLVPDSLCAAIVAGFLGLLAVVFAIVRESEKRQEKLREDCDNHYRPAVKRVMDKLARALENIDDSIGGGKEALNKLIRRAPKVTPEVWANPNDSDAKELTELASYVLDVSVADQIDADRRIMERFYRRLSSTLEEKTTEEFDSWVRKLEEIHAPVLLLWMYLEYGIRSEIDDDPPNFAPYTTLIRRWLSTTPLNRSS